MERKLRAFQERHGLEGPPRDPQNGLLVFGLILIVGLLEVLLNGYFFAEANALGYVGGVAIAAVIAVVNVSFSYALGGQVRFLNRANPLWKLWGLVCLLTFVAFAATLNLAVAHFRDALEVMAWDAALVSSIDRLVAGPVDLRSFASWLVVGFGGLVSLVAYWKGMTRLDPMPGYNAIYADWEAAIDDYAEAYGDAQDALEDAFVAAREKLEEAAQSQRQGLRAAIDAVQASGTLARSLDAFLETCDEAANRLIRLYRDANLRARSDDGPAYFNEPFAFPSYRPPQLPEADREAALQEVRRIDDTLRVGVSRLLDARESALDAYPTVREIKAGVGGDRPRVVSGRAA
jgi:hypothetical protein